MEHAYWKQMIEIEENGIFLVFGITRNDQIKFLHFSSVPQAEDMSVQECRQEDECRMMDEGFPLVQLELAGYDRPYERHGNKYVVTSPGCYLKYENMQDTKNESGRMLQIRQKDPLTGVCVQTDIQFYDGVPVARFVNHVTNEGEEEQVLTYLSSFTCSGIKRDGNFLYIPHNGWQKELNWRRYSFEELGFPVTQTKSIRRSSKTIEVYNTGNWSTKEYLPMGFLSHPQSDAGLIWQIENNGSWHYEIGDQNCHFYLAVSGPTEIQSHWSKNLKPGDSFTTVPVAVGVGHDDFEEAIPHKPVRAVWWPSVLS